MSEFRFDYDPGTISYGRDSVAEIEAALASVGSERALLVTGETVGSTPEVVDPVREGCGDRLAGTFAETTPEKTLSTAFDGARRMADDDIDALVAVGGGSSLDTAKVMSVLAATEQSPETVRKQFEETGGIAVPDGELSPVVAVPTTLAGADLSVVAGITSRRDGLVRGGVSDARLMPGALFYDPALFETTPHGVLCGSAMNGFDKGVETLYSRNATPITDGTAVRGLRLLSRGLPRLGAGERDDETLRDSILGTVLVQYGCSRADGVTLSLIHAFGHGIARGYEVQQGGAHGIVAPHALRYLFDAVDGRRDLLAEAFGVRDDDPEQQAEAVVDAVTEVRDGLGLLQRLREIPDMAESDLPSVAEDVTADGFMANGPPELEPTVEEIEGVLREAW